MSAIHDLARALGVSISTVSRALAGKENVTQATRARVLEAAARIGYAPNHAARGLRSGATRSVTFVLTPHPQLLYSDSFFMPLLAGVQEALARHRLDLVVSLGQAGDAQLGQLRRLVESRSTDAVLLAWTRAEDSRIQYLADIGFPFATLGRSGSGGHFPYLDIDFDDIGARAASRLLARGHRRIALVNTSPTLMFHRFLRDGYRRALDEAGVAFDAALTLDDPMSDAGGGELVARLLALAAPPTALIVSGEAALAGIWRALGETGARPGQDIAVIAVTASPLCAYLQPQVTHFDPPLHAMGERLADILVAAMPGPARRVVQDVRRLALVEGASDGPPPAPARQRHAVSR